MRWSFCRADVYKGEYRSEDKVQSLKKGDIYTKLRKVLKSSTYTYALTNVMSKGIRVMDDKGEKESRDELSY